MLRVRRDAGRAEGNGAWRACEPAAMLQHDGSGLPEPRSGSLPPCSPSGGSGLPRAPRRFSRQAHRQAAQVERRARSGRAGLMSRPMANSHERMQGPVHVAHHTAGWASIGRPATLRYAGRASDFRHVRGERKSMDDCFTGDYRMRDCRTGDVFLREIRSIPPATTSHGADARTTGAFPGRRATCSRMSPAAA